MSFLRHLKERGLNGVELFITDKCLGLVESIAECYPNVRWQRCVVSMLKAMHAQEDRKEELAKAKAVVRNPAR